MSFKSAVASNVVSNVAACKTAGAIASAVWLAACAAPSPTAIPSSLQPRQGEHVVMALEGKGVQIYQCRRSVEHPFTTEWVFVAPRADLFDAEGKKVGKHYDGPHWEANDGSKVLGTVVAKANAPLTTAIPWLLLSAQSDGPPGAFSNVTAVQRVRTVGGNAPEPDSCRPAQMGQTEQVYYSADYLLLAK